MANQPRVLSPEQEGNPLFLFEQTLLKDFAGLGEFLLGNQTTNDYLRRFQPQFTEMGLSHIEARCVLHSVCSAVILDIYEMKAQADAAAAEASKKVAEPVKHFKPDDLPSYVDEM